MFDTRTLPPDAKIGDLPLERFVVRADLAVPEMGRMFSIRPELFATMVHDGGQLLGVVSRSGFSRLMVRPDLAELYQHRTIGEVVRAKGADPLRLPANMPIGDAGEQALARHADWRYEPVLVTNAANEVALLNADVLFLSMAAQLKAEITAHRDALEKVRAAETELKRMVRTDPLTGVANRRHMKESLRVAFEHARRAASPISVILLDIDFFKKCNDHYGHQQGDRCLRDVAQAIDGTIHRAGDIVARYGGEEFIIVLPDTPLNGAHLIAERVRAAVAALEIPHAASDAAPHVSVSLGIATRRPGRGDTPRELVEAADRALYTAKARGRNRVYCKPSDPEDRNAIFRASAAG